MNRTKHIIKLVIFAAAAALLVVLGSGKDLFSVESLNLTWENIGRVLLIIFGVLAIEYLIILILSFIQPKNHRARTVISITASLIRYIAVIVIIIGVMSMLRADITTIIAGLGIIALIIGFGAESLITDVVTGFFILMDNQYNVGDIIEVGGFRGTVSDIGIRTTSLTDTGGNVKIINNSDMKNILNRSDNSSKAVADFAIPYETDLEKLEQKIPALLTEIYNSNTDIFKSEPKYLGVQELGESSVVLRFVAEVGEKDIYSGARRLNRDLFIGMRRLGVECPFNQLDVHTK